VSQAARTHVDASRSRKDLQKVAGGVVLFGLLAAASAVFSFRGTSRTPEILAPTTEHQGALARLVADELPIDGVTLRDWAAIDGDGILLNGTPVVLDSTPVPIVLAPGVLTLTAFAGELGCVTLEVSAPGRPPYQLCLPAGSESPSIPVR
jgi:hypothetical protein